MSMWIQTYATAVFSRSQRSPFHSKHPILPSLISFSTPQVTLHLLWRWYWRQLPSGCHQIQIYIRNISNLWWYFQWLNITISCKQKYDKKECFHIFPSHLQAAHFHRLELSAWLFAFSPLASRCATFWRCPLTVHGIGDVLISKATLQEKYTFEQMLQILKKKSSLNIWLRYQRCLFGNIYNYILATIYWYNTYLFVKKWIHADIFF